MQEKLSVLLLVLPLLFAPVTALLNNARIAWILSMTLCTLLLGLSVWLLIGLQQGQTIIYQMGGWQPPWGIEYVLDPLNGLMAVILSAAAWLSCLYGCRSGVKDLATDKFPLFNACFQLCLLGLMGISLTGDIFNLFVFLEISSLATYAMVAMGKHRKALLAAFNYLILGTLGATCFLIGVGLLYGATGSLNMAELSQLLADNPKPRLLNAASAFIVIGLGLKAAVFPLHHWLPGVYVQAPQTVTIFLSATATKIAIYALIRFLFGVIGADNLVDSLLPTLLLAAACGAVLYGSYLATKQTELKAIFAYSSLAQIGYMVMGIALLTQAGLTASLVHVFNHALIKACLFMLAGVFIYRANSSLLSELQGMGKMMKSSFVLMLIAGLSLIGVPGTVGFISKWLLVSAAWEAGAWPVIVVVVVGSLLAIAYIWKIAEALYFVSEEKLRIKQVETGDTSFARTPLSMLLPCVLLATACIYFGMQSQLPLALAEQASRLMLGGS